MGRAAYHRYLLLILISAALLFHLGCSSSGKSGDVDSATQESAVVSAQKGAPSEGDILSQYSYLELNAAANFLTLIFDRSLEAKTSETIPMPDAISECKISGEKARDMLMPLKALIDVQLPVERDAYVRDPASYATERGFDTCGRHCNCGPLASVVEGVFLSSLKTRKEKSQHQKYQERLQAKAERLLDLEKLACARRTEWFCESPLRAYLEVRAADGP